MSRLGISFSNDIPLPIANILAKIDRTYVNGSIDKVVKHKLANTSDSSAIASTASETNFDITYTLSTVMMQPGRIFKIVANGVYSTTGTPTLLFKVKWGSTDLVTFTARTGINNASNQSWQVEAWIVVRSIGASGTVMASGKAFVNTAAGQDTVETVVNNAATTIDTTTAQTCQVSLTWSASSSSNTATLKNFVLLESDY